LFHQASTQALFEGLSHRRTVLPAQRPASEQRGKCATAPRIYSVQREYVLRYMNRLQRSRAITSGQEEMPVLGTGDPIGTSSGNAGVAAAWPAAVGWPAAGV